ncbi:MAG TPA: hypothetical protein VIF09_14045, partial [Polyangiaceae bacterium]
LALVPLARLAGHLEGNPNARGSVAVVCETLDEVRDVAAMAHDVAPHVRAVLAPFIPSQLVALLSAAGIAALRVEGDTAGSLESQRTVALPPPAQWAERKAMTVAAGAGKVQVTWLALGAERDWATGGPRPEPAEARSARR